MDLIKLQIAFAQADPVMLVGHVLFDLREIGDQESHGLSSAANFSPEDTAPQELGQLPVEPDLPHVLILGVPPSQHI